MAYQTVFETSVTKCPLWFPAFGLVFVGIGIVLLRRRHGLAKVLQRFAFAWIFFGFALLWTITAFTFAIGECRRCVQTLSRGTAEVVEGSVKDFIPMPRQGHQDETFTVNGVRFSYSDFRPTCGFNNTASHGGPIRSGLGVRIHYVGNLILKLEIAR